MSVRTIYGLEADDHAGAIRYVGATTRRYLCDRLTGHRADARLLQRTSPACAWIREVLARGSEIKAVVLERDADEAAEARWIVDLRSRGADLLNARSGGGSGGSFDERSRSLLSLANKTTFADPARRRLRSGELCPNAKLTDSEVIRIREMHGGGASQRRIAVVFGIDRSTVGQIVSRRTWAHV